jgi:hypothetical protein
VADVVAAATQRRAAVAQPRRRDQGRVEDRHAQHQHRHQERRPAAGLEGQQDADHGQHEAQKEAAGVAHVDRGRVEVVAQKPQRAAGDGDGQRCHQELAVDRGDDKERDGGDRGHAAGQPVHVVQQVEGVGDAGDPHHRHGDVRRLPGQHAHPNAGAPHADSDSQLQSQAQPRVQAAAQVVEQAG